MNYPQRMYSKTELGLLYFPDTTDGATARRHIMVWIKRCEAGGIKKNRQAFLSTPGGLDISQNKYLVFLPKLGHILQSLTLGLRNELPYKDGSEDTDNTIQAIGEPIAQAVSHRNERGRNNPVENPLEGYGNRYGSTTNRIREYLGNKYPADWSPREHE